MYEILLSDADIVRRVLTVIQNNLARNDNASVESQGQEGQHWWQGYISDDSRYVGLRWRIDEIGRDTCWRRSGWDVAEVDSGHFDWSSLLPYCWPGARMRMLRHSRRSIKGG